jgi:tight adherence protein C
MDTLSVTFGAGSVLTGIAMIAFAMRRPAVDVAGVLVEFEDTEAELDAYSERLSEPLAPRLLKPAGRTVGGWVRGLLPGNYLERIRHKLVIAGLADRLGPEEFVALQAIGIAAGMLTGLLASALFGWWGTGSVRALVVFAVAGAVAPVQWLQKNREARQRSVRRDLPDVLDLLAISVEAGVGLEGAIEVVGEHFDSPLALEMRRMLREMELGVPRRTALQNLKNRIEVPDVSAFILSLIQADALGMPIGRVLRAQAAEMRVKRRQWARERAAKLPVKILFPLIMFILPALFVVVLGPAVISISRNIL